MTDPQVRRLSMSIATGSGALFLVTYLKAVLEQSEAGGYIALALGLTAAVSGCFWMCHNTGPQYNLYPRIPDALNQEAAHHAVSV